MAIMKMNINSNCCQGCGEKGPFVHCWWVCKLVQPFCKTVWSFLKKLKTELLYGPEFYSWVESSISALASPGRNYIITFCLYMQGEKQQKVRASSLVFDFLLLPIIYSISPNVLNVPKSVSLSMYFCIVHN